MKETTMQDQWLALPESITALVEPLLEQTQAPGATVALMIDGHPVVEAGIGWRDMAQITRLHAEALFPIYSVTKTILAMLVLQSVAQGQIKLDAPIQAYLPGLPLATPMSVKHLLTHTSGLPDYGALPAYSADLKAAPQQPWTAELFLEHTLAQGLAFAPGQGWRYSNLGFMLLRQLIEQVSQQSLAELVAARIAQPLQLAQTRVVATLQDMAQLTPGYSAFWTTDPQDMTICYHPGWVAHGLISSTAPELAQIVKALFAGHMLPPDVLRLMREPIPVPGSHRLFQQPAYGCGLMIDPGSAYGAVAGHGGGGPGYAIGALHAPNLAGHQIVSIACVNRDGKELGLQIAFAMLDMLAKQLGG